MLSVLVSLHKSHPAMVADFEKRCKKSDPYQEKGKSKHTVRWQNLAHSESSISKDMIDFTLQDFQLMYSKIKTSDLIG